MKYALIYYGGRAPDTEQEQKQVMQAWEAWFGRLATAVVDGGSPFSGQVNTLSADGSSTPGPVGEKATGYSILEADSLEAATGLAKGCPLLQSGGRIAVYEAHQM